MDNDEKKNSIEENIDNEQVDKGISGDPVDGEVFQKTTKVIKIGSKLSITVTSKTIAIICGIAVLVAFIGAAIGIGLANGKGNGGDENNINDGENTDENEETECQHQYGEWVIDTDPDCEAAGEKHRDCSLCDNRQIEAIPMTNHTPVTDAAVEPTCKSEGLTEGSHCSLCGHVFVSQQRIEKVEHEYDGENDESCNNCDYIRDVSCSHSETKIISGYGASCTTPGKTDGKKCALCGEILVSQKQIPARGHSFADYSCRVCHTDQPAGLYDENEQLVASWDELVNTYGLDVQTDYGAYFSKPNYYRTAPSSGYSVFSHEDLSAGVKLVIGNEVTRIGESAFRDSSIKDVFISKSIEFIGEGALEHCEKLKTVTFADDCVLTAIDNFAFIRTAIEEIALPDGLETLGSQVFGYCEQLKRVYIPASVTEMVYSVFDDCPLIEEFVVDEENTRFAAIDGNLYNKNATYLMRYAPAKEDEVFTIPDGVELIEHCAFGYANNLKTLIIGFDVRYISSSAFHNCTSLSWFEVDYWNPHYASVDGNLYQKDYIGWYSDDLFLVKYAPGKPDSYFALPEKVTMIGTQAFEYNTHLIAVDLGEVEYIDIGAFDGCKNLETLKISNKLQTVNSWAFSSCYSLKTVLYSGSQDEWDNIEIDNISDLNDPLLNANIIYNYYLGTEGFSFEESGEGTCNVTGVEYYTDIENSDVIIIPSEYNGWTVTGIAPYAFEYADLQGKQLILPDTITSIGENAFAYADMAAVYLPEGLLEIGYRAFACSDIPEIYIPGTVVTIGDEAFWESEIECVCIPEGVTSIGSYAFYYCENLRTLIYNTDLSFDSYVFSGCHSISEIFVPYSNRSYKVVDGHLYDSDVWWLYLYASGSEDEVYVIPDTVVHVNFISNCANLKKIVVSASVQTINCENCPALECFEVSEDNEYYKSINGSLYSKDGKSLWRQAYTSGAKDIVIADGTVEVFGYAFELYKSVDSLFIPKSVSRFWEYAFHGEYEIKDVYYEGTEEEWQALFDNSYGNYYLFYEATVHYNCAR